MQKQSTRPLNAKYMLVFSVNVCSAPNSNKTNLQNIQWTLYRDTGVDIFASMTPTCEFLQSFLKRVFAPRVACPPLVARCALLDAHVYRPREQVQTRDAQAN